MALPFSLAVILSIVGQTATGRSAHGTPAERLDFMKASLKAHAVHPRVPLILCLGVATLGSGRQDSDDRAERLRAMQAIATGVTIETASPGPHQRLERLAQPVYRFNDPARRTLDGTVWVWCDSGRPGAVVTLTKHRSPAEDLHWLTELTSLAPGPISAAIEGIGTWQPAGAGVVMEKLPKAPVPAQDEKQRLRQMKDLVRLIKAHENSRPRENRAVKRYELRVLPQPVHRYADANSGLIDGGMFIVAYGLNPELVMLVEARRDGSSGPAWHCGFARISVMDLHVDFESREIWSHRGGPTKGPGDTYWLFTRPIEGE